MSCILSSTQRDALYTCTIVFCKLLIFLVYVGTSMQLLKVFNSTCINYHAFEDVYDWFRCNLSYCWRGKRNTWTTSMVGGHSLHCVHNRHCQVIFWIFSHSYMLLSSIATCKASISSLERSIISPCRRCNFEAISAVIVSVLWLFTSFWSNCFENSVGSRVRDCLKKTTASNTIQCKP